MDIALPAELQEQLARVIASGSFQSEQDVIEAALRRFFEEEQGARRRLQSLRRIGQAIDNAGLYEKALLPGDE